MNRTVLYFTAPYQVVCREEGLPAYSADQLLVQTAFSAISAGSELLLYRGELSEEESADAHIPALQSSFQYPCQYGYSCVGHVIAQGAAIPENWLGRAVFSFQPHQSHFVAEPAQLFPLEKSAEPQDTLLPNMETAVGLVMDGQPIIGERVLVLGQGIVGLLVTTLLAQFPLAQLSVVDRHPLRREHALRLGAHTATATLPAEGDFDLVYELSGNPQLLNGALTRAGYAGRIVIGSWYGTKSAELQLNTTFHRQQLTLISSQVSTLHPRWRGRWTKERRWQTAWQQLQQHPIAPLITQITPIHQAAAAYELLHKQNEKTLQLIFNYPHLG